MYNTIDTCSLLVCIGMQFFTVSETHILLIDNCVHSYKLAFSLKLRHTYNKYCPSHCTRKYSFRVLVSQPRAAFSNRCENHSVLPTPTTFYPAPLWLRTMDITIIIIIIAHTQCSVPKTFSAHIIILYLPITPIHIYIYYLCVCV